jgi:glycosyltransferase involved in cell wall biosynthesis
MGKIKVMYISHSPELCGGEICLLNLLKQIDRNRYDAVVVLPVDGPLRAKIEEIGYKTYLSPLEWWVKVEGSFHYKSITVTDRLQGILNIIDDEKPDLIHTNTSVVFEGAIAAKIRNIPHIWHIHEVLNGHPTLEALFPLPVFYRIIEQLSDKVIVVSNDMKKELSSFVSYNKLKTIYNGIDTSTFNNIVDTSIRQEFSIPDDYLIAITVATIHKYKGHDNLLESASLAKQKGCKIKYLLVGPGSSENIDNLNNNINRLKLKGDVIYTGFRNDISRLVSGSDFFVLPSVKEGFPLVVLEAMALKKPIIATDCCGPADMIDDGKTGYLVPVANPVTLSDKIIELAKDKALIKNMGLASYDKYNDNFTLKVYADSFTNLYNELIRTSAKTILTESDTVFVLSLLIMYQQYVENSRCVNYQYPNIMDIFNQLSAKKSITSVIKAFARNFISK